MTSGSLLDLVKALGDNAWVVKKILVKYRIYTLRPGEWVPFQASLDIYDEVARRFGEHTLFSIGKKIPDCVQWPPHIKTIEQGLGAIDIAYHMNHRLNGKPMFDPVTGTMLEGIGHYRYENIGTRRALMICDTPLLSEIDRGIMTSLACSFRPAAEVVLDETRPTRKKGAESCTYIVTW